ncbi:hypothetical protein CC79DRAFT_3038 [Sarocladium strictum]
MLCGGAETSCSLTSKEISHHHQSTRQSCEDVSLVPRRECFNHFQVASPDRYFNPKHISKDIRLGSRTKCSSPSVRPATRSSLTPHSLCACGWWTSAVRGFLGNRAFGSDTLDTIVNPMCLNHFTPSRYVRRLNVRSGHCVYCASPRRYT